MTNISDRLVQDLNLQVIEEVTTPARAERRSSLPEGICNSPMEPHLPGLIGRDDATVWSHQAAALAHLQNGRNVAVATGTASGKSLVFQIEAFRRVLQSDRGKVLIFYPMKALASDQVSRWEALAARLGLPASAVGKIDGDVSTHERGAILETARIVVMTPDVCHAWLMRNVSSGPVRSFLEELELMVLDEAHVYESVFGSNVAYLLRRLIAVQRNACQRSTSQTTLQFIAATATISAPEEHLRKLTGQDFVVVGETENGAPHFQRQVVHINGKSHGSGAEQSVQQILRGVLNLDQRFIAFVDSRQGVERIVRALGDSRVLPYRSGYQGHDRKKIEMALRNGSLTGVVSTSALELGIDIPDMRFGLTLGVPQSRKALHQRVGRVGRASEGTFFVIAPEGGFGKLGVTFAEYFAEPVEPSHLYLGNRFIQFAQARCLLDEMEGLKRGAARLPKAASWPEGFSDIVACARPGGARPREFDYIAQLGSDAPHVNYPLRQVGEASLEIHESGCAHSGRLGSIAAHQALREAYPGATYLHLGKSYRVKSWQSRQGVQSIKVHSAKGAPTAPLLKKSATLSLNREGIVDGRHLLNETGEVAEVELQVNERVEGYRIGQESFWYSDLRADDPAMTRKQRDFRTTGILIRIGEPWFSGSKGEAPKRREGLARGLLGILAGDYSISPHDIDALHTNIAIMTESGPSRMTDAIVIYDAVYGSLRLTEPLFDSFSDYVRKLDRGADLGGDDAYVDEETSQKLELWSETLRAPEEADKPRIPVPDGWHMVYRPESVVSVFIRGRLVERKLIKPVLMDLPGETKTKLYYQYQSDGCTSLVPDDQIEATGHDWSWVLWNPDTDALKELDDSQAA